MGTEINFRVSKNIKKHFWAIINFWRRFNSMELVSCANKKCVKNNQWQKGINEPRFEPGYIVNACPQRWCCIIPLDHPDISFVSPAEFCCPRAEQCSEATGTRFITRLLRWTPAPHEGSSRTVTTHHWVSTVRSRSYIEQTAWTWYVRMTPSGTAVRPSSSSPQQNYWR